MKKMVLVVLLVLILSLCSCEKKEYKLIELNGNELLQHLFKEKTSIVIGIYYESDPNGEQFLKDLEKTAKRAKENIYYINVNRLEPMTDLIVSSTIEIDDLDLKYFVYQDGEKIVEEDYTDFDKMYSDLNGKKYDSVELMSEDDIKQILDAANEAYDLGYVSTSLGYLYTIWNVPEAKKLFEERDLYKLIKDWEYFEIKDRPHVIYKGLRFLAIDEITFWAEKEGDIPDFERPGDDEYDSYTFQIRNKNKLCIGEDVEDTSELECKYEFEILSLEDDFLKLKLNDDIYNFSVMEEVG